jgi:hypothetical protein
MKSGPYSLGFTFAISAIIISLTLLSLSEFKSEWIRMTDYSLQDKTPSFIFLKSKISQDLSEIFKVKGNAVREYSLGSLTFYNLSINFPFDREGVNLSKKLSKYASSYRSENIGISIFSNLSGEYKKAIIFSDNASLSLTNELPLDVVVFRGPNSGVPRSINIVVKTSNIIESEPKFFQQSLGGASSVGYNFIISDSLENHIFQISFQETLYHNDTFYVKFVDGSELIIQSSYPPFFIYAYYTKSPSSYLVLPFDFPAPLKDYSKFNHSFAYSNVYITNSDCIFGDCLVFNPSSQINSSIPFQISVSHINIDNGDFENVYPGDRLPE